MTDLPPLLRDQRKVDADHLRLLGIFHFVIAGLAVLGLGFLCLHYAFMQAILSNPEVMKNQKGGPPPEQIIAIFKWFYVVVGAFLVAGGLANLLSGLFLRRRKCRTFSLIVAGINCIQIPLGTVLGVFTFVVLGRESVVEAYEASATDGT